MTIFHLRSKQWSEKYWQGIGVLAVVLFVHATGTAQTRSSSLKLTATLSETVTLSTPPNYTHSDGNIAIVSSGSNTLQITASGDDTQFPIIRLPLVVRSNTSFKITAAFESQTVELAELSVIDPRASGTLVNPQVVNALEVRSLLDPDVSRPLVVLSGPRVSLGGSLISPKNALQLTLLIRFKGHPIDDWLVHLTLVSSPESQL